MGSVDKGLPLAEFKTIRFEHLPDSQTICLTLQIYSLFLNRANFPAIFFVVLVLFLIVLTVFARVARTGSYFSAPKFGLLMVYYYLCSRLFEWSKAKMIENKIQTPSPITRKMDAKQLYELYREHPQITTDSRDCPEGSIFIALKGESFDGNQFAIGALDKGCAYAIIDDADIYGAQSAAYGERLILVPDCVQALKDIAREHRRQFNIPVIAITGTNGKTTTKELIAAVLQKKYRVLYTQGNYNNDVGVPKTLLRLTADHDIAVIEMGASHPGDIRTLAETAEPTCGLITNVGRAHLAGFGTLKNVAKTKGELYDYLGRRGETLIFVNADNERLVDMLPDNVWVAPYSANAANAEGCTCGEVTGASPFVSFRWRESDSNLEERGASVEWYDVQTQLIGTYNIDNLMAAVAVGLNFAVSPEDINAALAAYRPSNNRSQLTITEHNHLVVDAYNANPTSMRAALENFRQMNVCRKMAILGQMGELGTSSRKEHQKIVDMLIQMTNDEAVGFVSKGNNQAADVWLVGDEYADIDCPFRKFHNVEEVKAAIAATPPQDLYILIKGSNAVRLYELPPLL